MNYRMDSEERIILYRQYAGRISPPPVQRRQYEGIGHLEQRRLVARRADEGQPDRRAANRRCASARSHFIVNQREDLNALAINLWHSEAMKALKSKLAMELLADPKARVELRRFFIAQRPNSGSTPQSYTGQIQIHRGTSPITVNATVVPKAKVG